MATAKKNRRTVPDPVQRLGTRKVRTVTSPSAERDGDSPTWSPEWVALMKAYGNPEFSLTHNWQALAAEIGVSPQAMYSWVRQKNRVTMPAPVVKLIRLLAAAKGVTSPV